MSLDPRPIAALESSVCRGLRALFCDLDDTLTTEGKLRAAAFSALWRAHEAGLAVVVVTGRPAGWADHLARMWPVHGVIGENGGLSFRHSQGSMQRYFAYSAEERAVFRRRLAAIGEEILREVPGCAIAADQPYREFDLAIDYAEDVGPLPAADVLRIRQIFLKHGACAKISSIHVNGWFGDFDKLATARRYLERELALDPGAARTRVLFIGDSPNDEPMFSFFPHTVGVAGIRRYAEFMTAWPAFITEHAGGEGFAEAVDTILEKRA
jgi:HAD superfamily hydrolase (TIGR01484 family)